MAIAGMILGIISIPLGFVACYGGVAFLPLILGVAAVVLGSIGMMRDQNRKGLGVAGLVCGLVGLLITLICFACVGCAVCQYGGLVRLGTDLANELAAYGY